MKFLAGLLIVLNLLVMDEMNAYAKRITHEIQTEYTWPRGSDKDAECELAKSQAEGKVRDFTRKIGRTNIISVEVGACECKLGPDKQWGCRTTAAIAYWEIPDTPLEKDVKQSILEKYVEHVIPSKEKSLSPFLSLYKMNRTKAVLKGTRILKYVNRYQKMKSNISAAENLLNTYSTKGSDIFTKEANNLIRQLDRQYNSMQSISSDLSRLERQIVQGDFTALQEMERQKQIGYNAAECVQSSSEDGLPTLENKCNYDVWVVYCSNTGKKSCGSGSKYYTHSRKLSPGKPFNSKYSMPPSGKVTYGACYERSPSKLNKDGSYACRNPYL